MPSIKIPTKEEVPAEVNSDLEIKYPSKDLIAILASNLTKMDIAVSNPSLDPTKIQDLK